MTYTGTKIGADGRRYTAGQEPTVAADYRNARHADDQSVPPPDPSAFGLLTKSGPYYTVAGGGAGGNYVQFNPFPVSNSWATFRTDDIPDLTESNSMITVPAGLWDLHFRVAVTCSVAPTEGYLDVQMPSWEGSCVIPFNVMASQNYASVQISEMLWLEQETDLQILTSNFYNQTATFISGIFNGKKISDVG